MQGITPYFKLLYEACYVDLPVYTKSGPRLPPKCLNPAVSVRLWISVFAPPRTGVEGESPTYLSLEGKQSEA
jgi:hypothetical protein